jgi:hypothetical protein
MRIERHECPAIGCTRTPLHDSAAWLAGDQDGRIQLLAISSFERGGRVGDATDALAFAARQLLGHGVDSSSWCRLSFLVVGTVS